MRFLRILPVLVVSMASVAPVTAQPVDSRAETKVVLRISRDLIRDLTGVHFDKVEPIATTSDGAEVVGQAQVAGTFDVKLHQSATASDFDLQIAGTVLTQLTATRRPVLVHTHGVAPFTACCRITLKEHQFRRHDVQVSVSNQFTLDEIDSFRGGAIGALTRGLARPIVRRSLRGAERDTAGQIRTQVAQAFAEAADKVVEKLNQIEPLAKKVKEDLQAAKIISQKDLHHYYAATDEYLWLSIGHRDERMPTLAEKDPARRAPIELWFTNQNGALEPLVKKWRILRPVFEKIITRKSPELRQILFRAHLDSEAGWHVIRFTPDLTKMPEIHLP